MNKKHATILDFGILGELDVIIEFSYFEGEKPSRGGPGEPEEFLIHSIKVVDKAFSFLHGINLILNVNCGKFNDIEKAVREDLGI